MKKVLLVITLCLLSFQTAQAEFKTGNGLAGKFEFLSGNCQVKTAFFWSFYIRSELAKPLKILKNLSGASGRT